LPSFTLPPAPFVFLNGALSVASGFEAAAVLLCVCVPLELVFSAATLVVTVVLLEILSLGAEPEEVEEVEEDKARCVVVKVHISVFVLPLVSDVVNVLTSPGSLVVVVYVEPALSVLVITTGIRPVNPSDAVEMDVTVDGDPDIVVVLHSVTG